MKENDPKRLSRGLAELAADLLRDEGAEYKLELLAEHSSEIEESLRANADLLQRVVELAEPSGATDRVPGRPRRSPSRPLLAAGIAAAVLSSFALGWLARGVNEIPASAGTTPNAMSGTKNQGLADSDPTLPTRSLPDFSPLTLVLNHSTIDLCVVVSNVWKQMASEAQPNPSTAKGKSIRTQYGEGGLAVQESIMKGDWKLSFAKID